MSATVTVSRDLIEQFIIEVDALAKFETIRNGGYETGYQEHIYSIIDPVERAVFGSMPVKQSERLHDLGTERGRELARDFFSDVFAREVAS